MKETTLTIAASEEHAGLRLDKVLSLATSDYSRTALARFIRDGRVTVGGARKRPSYSLRPGDEILAVLPLVELDHIDPEFIPLEILHEDDDLLVINKPSNLTVHPAGGGRGGTLVNALAYHCSHLSDVNGPLRPGIVHRLDRDTSGLILAAKNNRAHRTLADQFRNRTVHKEYLAVVCGAPPQLEGEISLPIGRDRRMPRKMAVRHAIGKPALSYYRVQEQFDGFTLVSVRIRTGRTHQIRVHMSASGCPVVADAMYGGGAECRRSELERKPAPPGETPLIERQALHAHHLAFDHPTNGERMEFVSPPAADIQLLLEALRETRS